jgi:hypothetical protein
MEAIHTSRGIVLWEISEKDIERLPKARVRRDRSHRSEGGMRTIDPRTFEFIDSEFGNIRVGCRGKS